MLPPAGETYLKYIAYSMPRSKPQQCNGFYPMMQLNLSIIRVYTNITFRAEQDSRGQKVITN